MSTPHDGTPRRAWQTDNEWGRLRARVDAAASDPTSHRRRTRRYAWGAAAAASLLLACGLYWNTTRGTALSTEQEFTTLAGERRTVRLADSTQVALGPATTIRARITGEHRHVELNGLADFRVTHEEKRPFVVRAMNAVTTDLGTEFSVRAYPADTTVTVVVTSGRVSLAAADGARAVALSGGEAGTVSANGTVASLGSAAPEAIAWLKGTLAFNNVSVRDAAVELSRWFAVDLQVPDTQLAARRITAQYVRPTLDDVISALSTTLGARVERRDRAIILAPAKR